jgi:HNH endonuclease
VIGRRGRARPLRRRHGDIDGAGARRAADAFGRHLRIDGHHITRWRQGGATELDNLVLLCHRHHWMVHEGGWELIRRDYGAMTAIAPMPAVERRARAPDTTPVG